MANDYKVGQVWEDREGDPWTVVQSFHRFDGLDFADNSGSRLLIDAVEEDWGPLKLVEDVPEISVEKISAYWPYSDQEVEDHTDFRDAFLNHVTKDLKAPPFTNDRIFEFGIEGGLADRVVALNGGEDYLLNVVDTYEAALQLLVRKSADYGPRNIADSPGGPLNGLRVRMWDKMARIKNLTETGAQPENEALRDSFLDLLNYSAIALMVIDGNWPGVKEDK